MLHSDTIKLDIKDDTLKIAVKMPPEHVHVLFKGIVSKTVVHHVSSVNVTIAVVVLWVPVIITVADY